MKPETLREVDLLEELTVAELREKYAEVFGEPTRSRHKRFLIKRVTWGLQARDEGGISEKARRRAEELARESDLRLLAPKGKTEVHSFKPKPPDRRIPVPGTVLTRVHRGRTVSCTVLDDGFEYQGEVYRSLSAVARAATGTRWNGVAFFGLTKKEKRS